MYMEGNDSLGGSVGSVGDVVGFSGCLGVQEMCYRTNKLQPNTVGADGGY